jgi:hypothetical protein
MEPRPAFAFLASTHRSWDAQAGPAPFGPVMTNVAQILNTRPQ